MYSSIFIFWFFTLLAACLAVDENKNQLKPLELPDDNEMDGNRSSLISMLKSSNINFLKRQLKSPSTKASIPTRMWSTATQLISTPKNLFVKNPYLNACESKQSDEGVIVTKRGDAVCLQKCKKENDEYVEYANKRLPHVFSILNVSTLKARFEPGNENLHECAPGFLYGFTCVCKHNVKTFVNQELQDMINEVFEIKKAEENGEGNASTSTTEETKKKINIVGRFLGLLAVILYFPNWLHSYMVWLVYGPK